MGTIYMDGIMLRKAIIAGSNQLNKNKALIDSLNVFPVPDGDTGTNMALTVLTVAKEVYESNTPNAYDVAKIASSGSLMGARGNSGVILSQLFRGFAKGLENKDVINGQDIANAFVKASETAYKAVMKPKEGTILSVARAIGNKAMEMAEKTDDIEEMMKEVIDYGNKVLDATTEMLPELKQANVVDAGGKGILVFLEGALEGMKTEGEIVFEQNLPSYTSKTTTPRSDISHIEFGYCTEFFINVNHEDVLQENKVKEYLQTIGDSIVVVSDNDIIKIHIHTEHPGSILEFALKMGDLSNLKIENMREQHSSLINFSKTVQNDEEKEIGFVAVSSGNGFYEIFKELGVDVVIEGGQSMNPSTDNIIDAIKQVKAKNIVVLPNNKNIISATKLAIEILLEKGRANINCIPTKNIPQGISAMANYLEGTPKGKNIDNMTEAISLVTTGQITHAVRDVSMNGVDIKSGDVLCILDDEIIDVATNIEQGTKQLIDSLLKDGKDLLSIYYGSDVLFEDANKIYEYAKLKYEDIEIEFKNGDQPIYHYLLSVE